MNKEEVVERFENIVNELKEPILKSTSVGVEHANNDSQQDLGEAIEGIERLLDDLYASIKKMILTRCGEGGVTGGKTKLDEDALEQIFERKNILSALKKNPGELKDPLLDKLHLLLKEYPFSPKVEFVDRLKEAGMQPPSKVIKIIPNTV
jgi:hypothetical protein